MFSQLAVILGWVGIHEWGKYVQGVGMSMGKSPPFGGGYGKGKEPDMRPGEGSEYLSPSLDQGPGMLPHLLPTGTDT